MGTIIVSTLLFIGISYFIIIKKYKGDEDFFEVAMFSLIPIICLSIIPALVLNLAISSIFFSDAKITTQIYDEREIVALSNGTNVSGKFFVGIGSYDNNVKYYFMEEVEGKGYKLNSIDSRKVIINETSDVNPNIAKSKKVYKDSNLEFWIGEGNLEFWISEGNLSKTIISVPEGTITKDFNIDLENN